MVLCFINSPYFDDRDIVADFGVGDKGDKNTRNRLMALFEFFCFCADIVDFCWWICYIWCKMGKWGDEMRNISDLHIAFRAGWLGDNILTVYFPFFANILKEESIGQVDEHAFSILFCKKYGVSVPIAFIRQVLAVGLANGSIHDDRGKYIVDKKAIQPFCFDNKLFEIEWEKRNYSTPKKTQQRIK